MRDVFERNASCECERNRQKRFTHKFASLSLSLSRREMRDVSSCEWETKQTEKNKGNFVHLQQQQYCTKAEFVHLHIAATIQRQNSCIYLQQQLVKWWWQKSKRSAPTPSRKGEVAGKCTSSSNNCTTGTGFAMVWYTSGATRETQSDVITKTCFKKRRWSWAGGKDRLKRALSCPWTFWQR